jgi:antitoxin Phd
MTSQYNSFMTNSGRQMSSWQLQDAKARFSDFLNAALEKGPQVVTRRGVEAAVLVPIEEWRRIQRMRRPGIKELLLSGPRFRNLVPSRRKLKRRAPVEFE